MVEKREKEKGRLERRRENEREGGGRRIREKEEVKG